MVKNQLYQEHKRICTNGDIFELCHDVSATRLEHVKKDSNACLRNGGLFCNTSSLINRVTSKKQFHVLFAASFSVAARFLLAGEKIQMTRGNFCGATSASARREPRKDILYPRTGQWNIHLAYRCRRTSASAPEKLAHTRTASPRQRRRRRRGLTGIDVKLTTCVRLLRMSASCRRDRYFEVSEIYKNIAADATVEGPRRRRRPRKRVLLRRRRLTGARGTRQDTKWTNLDHVVFAFLGQMRTKLGIF